MPNTNKKNVIIGVDPGLSDVGYGIIKEDAGKLYAMAYGHIRTNSKENFPDRLHYISLEISKIIKKYSPDFAAIEDVFFCKNVTSALRVGQAKGAIIVTCMMHSLIVHEFTPLQIKQAVSGYGKAEKKQMEEMVRIILGLKEIPKPDHCADALGAAICEAHSLKNNPTL